MILRKLFATVKLILPLSAILMLIVLCSMFLVQIASRDYIYSDINSVASKQAIIILGAKVYDNGRLSSMLQDRADTAAELFAKDKTMKILISGDHGQTDYDEVNTIKRYLLEKNVPAENIFLDHAGFDTYDSMYRARDVFEIKTAVVVTQGFHLPRAVYLARALGIDTTGLVADRQPYAGGTFINSLREVVADWKALVDVNRDAKPKFLGEKIPIDGDSKKSWD